ncbi:YhdP family protein [Paraglaciecola aestuariivivens]
MANTPKNGAYYVAYIIKKLWALLAISLVVVAVGISLLRYSLPYMQQQKHHVEQWLSSQIGAELSIAEISAKWQGLGPAIVLRDLRLVDSQQSPISLSIAETAIEVDFWQSVLGLQLQANKFDLKALELNLNLPSFEQKEAEYPIVEALEKLFLQQLQMFSISQSKIIINTANAQQQVVLIDQVSWVNKEDHHQGTGELQIEEIAKNSVSFVLDLYGQKDEIFGTFFAQGAEIDLSPWVSQWIISDHQLIESRGSFVMWASIEEKSLKSVQLDFSKSRFHWQDPTAEPAELEVQLEVLAGQLNARPLNDEWIFNLNNLNLEVNQNELLSNWQGKISPVSGLSLQHQDFLQIEALLPMFSLALPAEPMAMLQALDPKARLSQLYLNQDQAGNLALKAHLDNMQWQQAMGLPGMQNVSSELHWYNSEGRLHLKSKADTLAIDSLLANNIPYQRFEAKLYFQTSEHDFSVALHDSFFKSQLINLHPSAFYRSVDNHLALTLRVENTQVSQLPKLYPSELMGVETRDYLVASFTQGQVKGAQILWHGALNEFPYAQNQGLFQAQVQIEQGELKFDPNWPALTNLSLDLWFENQSLTMHSQQGQLLNVQLADLTAQIPHLAENATLSIDVLSHATGQQITELMLQSSIADSLGKTLEKVQIHGPLKTELALTIPLSGEQLIAKGRVGLQKNRLDLPDLNIELTQASGNLDFINEQVTASGLTGKLLDQEVTLNYSSELQNDIYQAKIQLAGDWQITPLLTPYSKSLLKYLSGHSKWSAEIDLSLPEEGYQYSATILSELDQLDSKLPNPFAKAKQSSLPLKVTSQGNQQASSINITLGQQVEFNGNLPHDTMQFSRAHLAIGESDLIGMGLGFSISANVAELDTAPWYDVIDALIDDLPDDAQAPLLASPKRIFINADAATIASQRVTDLEMVVKNNSDHWQFDVNAKQARMQIALYKDWLTKGVDIQADFIELNQWQSASDSSNVADFNPDLATLPPVKFTCKRCRFKDNDLGQIDFSLARSATGMKIENLRLKNTHGLFNGSGDWYLADGASSTRLTGDFSSSDFGAFLQDFNINSGIKDSKANSTFDISWQRAPYEFNFASLNGEIDWRLSDGYLTEVSDKGSRIFSLLSLESLVRKLQLDFRDIFAKGFFYDKMNGSFQLENGIAYTQDTEVDGGAGEITMQGYTDLSAQQLNYQIAFAPNVTSSLPVIIAWMVNPATALAAVALDQMLTSAKVISNIKFSLTGTLDDPQLIELGRDSKEVTLPARVQPPPTDLENQNDKDIPLSGV